MKNIFSKKINLERDWKMVISLFSIGLALVSIFAWKIYLSNHIGGGYFVIEAQSTDMKTNVIDREKLGKDLSILKNRQISQVKLVDPSI